jgi:hypothetical protein
MSKKNNEPVIETEEKVADITQVILAFGAVKYSVLKVLGGDAEKLFVQIEAALEFKKNQDDFSDLDAEEAAVKQLEKRNAEVLAMQEAAVLELEELYANVTQ